MSIIPIARYNWVGDGWAWIVNYWGSDDDVGFSGNERDHKNGPQVSEFGFANFYDAS